MRLFGEFGGLSDADEMHLPRQPCTYNNNSSSKKQDHFVGNLVPFQNGNVKCDSSNSPKKFWGKLKIRG